MSEVMSVTQAHLKTFSKQEHLKIVTPPRFDTKLKNWRIALRPQAL